MEWNSDMLSPSLSVLFVKAFHKRQLQFQPLSHLLQPRSLLVDHRRHPVNLVRQKSRFSFGGKCVSPGRFSELEISFTL
jgi:hypothetical protein